MFNYDAIDKTPTVFQVKAIISYMESIAIYNFDFSKMMKMQRLKPNLILLDLNDAHEGNKFEITFNGQDEILSFEHVGAWIS